MSLHPPSSILHPRRILVRSTNWLGDAVMSTPALLRLREKFPDAHITLLCPEKLRDLWLHHPAVDETITFAAGESVFSIAQKLRRWGETPGEPGLANQGVAKTARADARPTGFDLALVLPNSPRSALELFLAGIPQRIGYSRPWRNFFLTQPVASRPEAVRMHKRSVEEIKSLITDNSNLTTHNSKPASAAHQTREYLHLVAALGANPEPLAPQLVVTVEEIEAAKKKFGLDKITGPIFGLNPGAEYGPAKRWPAEKFIAAAKEIQQQTHCTWLICGGKGDVELAGRIAREIHSPSSILHPQNLAGQTSLRELMALLKLCRVLLTNDTGPMHVAAALGTPVVVPFGSTSPELTGPGLPGDLRHRLLKSDAPCSPCFLRECPIDFRCLNGISVERVVETVIAARKS
ncbi:MAG TPA: lipopolysaccharide heptosyltransferase II [bacterium]|nr:lipopolysaccharide heptosyltransferase II [bacterium]